MAQDKVIRVKYDMAFDLKGDDAKAELASISKSLERMADDMTKTLKGFSNAATSQAKSMKKLVASLETQSRTTKKQVEYYRELVNIQEEQATNASKRIIKEKRALGIIAQNKEAKAQAIKEERAQNTRTFKEARQAEDHRHALEMMHLKTEYIEKSKNAKLQVVNRKAETAKAKIDRQEALEARRGLYTSLKKEKDIERQILEINQKAAALDSIKDIDPLKKTKILKTELGVLHKQHKVAIELANEDEYKLRLAKATTAEEKDLLRVQQQQARLNVARLGSQIASKSVNLNQAQTAEDSQGVLGTIKHAMQVAPVYMAVAQGVNALQQSLRAVVEEAIEFDNTMRVLSAVTGENLTKTEALTHSIMDLGEAYGGSLADYAETAKELSRAGIDTDELVEATEVTAQLGLITGDTIQSASNAIISYSQVYQKAGNKMVYTTQQLGDKLAYMANASRLSTQDIGTLSNYALASSKSVGLTVDVVNGLAVAFSNATMHQLLVHRLDDLHQH